MSTFILQNMNITKVEFAEVHLTTTLQKWFIKLK